MARPKKNQNYDARFNFWMPSKMKENMMIKAIKEGYTLEKGGVGQYIIDLLKKDGVEDEEE